MVVPGLVLKALLLAAVTVPQFLLGAVPAAVPGTPASVAAAAPSRAVPTAAGRCESPAKVLDLTNWKITLPVPKPDNAKSPLEVTQPTLADYAKDPFFQLTEDCDGVEFRAPVNGTTTVGSHNPRSELREMTDNGKSNADWSSTAGEHRFTVNEAFTHLPEGKPQLVGVQIHDAKHDISVFRLEGSNLYVTHDNDSHYKLVTDHYVLGTRFDAGYEVSGGEVRAYYNGALQTTISDHFHGAYFKAGAYTQANCDDSQPCTGDNYGAVAVYSLSVFHHVTTWDLVWDWVTTWVPIGLAAILVLGIGFLAVRRVRTR